MNKYFCMEIISTEVPFWVHTVVGINDRFSHSMPLNILHLGELKFLQKCKERISKLRTR
jgi:hypothetical protein